MSVTDSIYRSMLIPVCVRYVHESKLSIDRRPAVARIQILNPSAESGTSF